MTGTRTAGTHLPDQAAWAWLTGPHGGRPASGRTDAPPDGTGGVASLGGPGR